MDYDALLDADSQKTLTLKKKEKKTSVEAAEKAKIEEVLRLEEIELDIKIAGIAKADEELALILILAYAA